MRMYMYFEADASHWWASEIRTYDGNPDGEWIEYTAGPYFKTPKGAEFVGNVDLTPTDGRSGHLTVTNMRLAPFLTGPTDQRGGPARPSGEQPTGMVPFAECVDGNTVADAIRAYRLEFGATARPTEEQLVAEKLLAAPSTNFDVAYDKDDFWAHGVGPCAGMDALAVAGAGN